MVNCRDGMPYANSHELHYERRYLGSKDTFYIPEFGALHRLHLDDYLLLELAVASVKFYQGMVRFRFRVVVRNWWFAAPFLTFASYVLLSPVAAVGWSLIPRAGPCNAWRCAPSVRLTVFFVIVRIRAVAGSR
jgi:hypothetical protein